MKLFEKILVIAAVCTLCVPAISQAQDQKQDTVSTSTQPVTPSDAGGGNGYDKPPAPAARGVTPAYDLPYDPSQVEPDPNTLSGEVPLTLGSLGHSRNIFDPSLSYSYLGQTFAGVNGQSSIGAQAIFSGMLGFDRTWNRYHLTALYNGGGTFDEGANTSSYVYQDLTLSQEVDLGRWRLLVRDDFMATPGASFTGTGTGGPGLLTVTSTAVGESLPNTGQSFVPTETVQTGNEMRYRESGLGQVQYSLSRRSTFTFSGSYSFLDFQDSGFISSHMVSGQAGYDYQLDPANSFALLGSYGKINYVQGGPAGYTTDYTAQVAVGRKITGRVALQLSAGPQEIRSVSSTGGDFDRLVPYVNTSITYEWRRSGISAGYVHGLNSGSGVLLGANSNTFSGSAHYLLTRFWTATVNGGYALNQSLVPSGTVPTDFNNWFAGASLTRVAGPYAMVNFSYGVQRQSSSEACPVIICGGNALLQSFGITVNLHLVPTEQ